MVTRPRTQSQPLVERLQALGATAVAVPTIRIVPPRPGGALDRALGHLHEYDWVVVTSANGARACLTRARALGVSLSAARPQWAAIGPATAAALRSAGVTVAVTPPRYLTEAIVAALPDVHGVRVLLPRTDAAPPGLAQALRERGAQVDEVTAYRTILAPASSRERVRQLVARRAVDTIIFTSASTVHGLVRLLDERRDALQGMTLACIGPVTAAAVAEHGLHPSVVAAEHTTDGVIAALIAHHETGRKGAPHARDRAAR
ncbi:MAG: uroporphyrinogen-III synthase [Armatimonadota bacterium]|nr:uroporphyrinogen-III synthase [Armatimonadota bacterium]